MSKKCLLIILLLTILVACAQPESGNAVDEVARQFNVPRERVIKVAEELGVELTDVGTFSSYFFPYGYYEHQFEMFEKAAIPIMTFLWDKIPDLASKCLSYGAQRPF